MHSEIENTMTELCNDVKRWCLFLQWISCISYNMNRSNTLSLSHRYGHTRTHTHSTTHTHTHTHTHTCTHTHTLKHTHNQKHRRSGTEETKIFIWSFEPIKSTHLTFWANQIHSSHLLSQSNPLIISSDLFNQSNPLIWSFESITSTHLTNLSEVSTLCWIDSGFGRQNSRTFQGLSKASLFLLKDPMKLKHTPNKQPPISVSGKHCTCINYWTIITRLM